MKKYLLISMWVFFVLSWCSLENQKAQDLTSPSMTYNTEYLEQEYTHQVTHLDEEATMKKITLRPHQQEVTLYEDWSPVSLWSYANTAEPLIIRAKRWEILDVEVINEIPQETSVHRHGVRVPNNQDGVPWVTQDPIAVSGTYNYRVPLQDAGTFFFHPHINTAEQMGKWLYGILIVEPEEYPFDFDHELVRALKDYRLNEDGTLNQNFASMMDFTHGGRLGNILTVNNVRQPEEKLEQGSSVLIRLINPSNARIYNLDLRSWDAQIVWTDGGFVAEPYDAWIVELSPWERIELLVSIGDQKLHLVDTYFSGNPNRLASISPISWSDYKKTWRTWDNSSFPDIPDWSNLTKREPDEIIDLGGIWVMWWDRGMMPWGERWRTIDNGIWPQTNKTLHWELWKVRIVRLQNRSGRDHPMHLHGDFFQVLEINGSKVPRVGWKDTINVPAQWYVDLAIIPTNPGTWMFHCHLIEHAEFGMMTTIEIQ